MYNTISRYSSCNIQNSTISLDTPKMPTNLTFVIKNDSESLQLSWNPPLSSIEYYTITISPPLQHVNCTKGECNTTVNDITVGGVASNTNYTITVAAVNCVGVGMSIVANFYTSSPEEVVISTTKTGTLKIFTPSGSVVCACVCA